MSRRLLFWSVTSSLAGFLFGFDTVVISGAEKTIQSLWTLSDELHGTAMAAALWGTVVGSLLGGRPADRFGRQKTLLWIGLLYLISAVWSGLATDVYQLIAARFIGGLGIGVCTVAAPMYISEIAPPRYRGRLTGMFQFNIVFGILVAFLSNALLARVGEDAWRWMLGVVAVPAMIYSLLCLTIPESPRWLIARKRDRAAGLQVLRQIDPAASEQDLESLADEIASHSAGPESTAGFWSKRLRTPILLAFFIAFFNQMSGINAVLYFAPRIFEKTGVGEQAALLESIGIGVTNLVFTFVGLWLIDRLGRKTLLTIGSFGYIASLGVCAWAFFAEHYAIVPVAIFAFIAAHAVGQGAVIWVFISEIFPTRYRAAGQSLGSFTHWIFAALLTMIFPSVVSTFAPGYVFSFFAAMMVLQLVWVWLLVPETKGVPLEELERKLGVAA
jgi:SP family arabinose:H+ symporter-like MFS transporter